MNDFVLYSAIALFSCFFVAYFLLNKIDSDLIPPEYEVGIDPFWSIWGTMLLGGIIAFHFYPVNFDMVFDYSYITFIFPVIFALLIYLCYLFELDLASNIFIFIGGLIASYMAPSDFILFPKLQYVFLDKLAIATIILVISKGFTLLNGLPAVSSIQCLTILLSIFALAYIGVLPQVLAVVAMAYFGVILAFTFFSWPPEKLILSQGAYSALGFIIACLMFNASVEYAESSMFVAASYLITEILVFMYNRFILGIRKSWNFMHTSYFKLSNEGKYTEEVINGLCRIMIVNIVLAVAQIYCPSRVAFPVFSIFTNFWFISILSGEAKPLQFLSITRLGGAALGSIFKKKTTKKRKNRIK
jgi:UDP-N-acetylmuramyl pentapeptide phosphotransferase/UDP-N-acetylglucosamine-1-phosphate transferase